MALSSFHPPAKIKMIIGTFLSLTFSISYVYAVYFTSLSRGHRDDPAVMISRMKNVVVSNIACLIVIVYLEMKLHNHSLFVSKLDNKVTF